MLFEHLLLSHELELVPLTVALESDTFFKKSIEIEIILN